MTEQERMQAVAAEAVRLGMVVPLGDGYVIAPEAYAALMTEGAMLGPNGRALVVEFAEPDR